MSLEARQQYQQVLQDRKDGIPSGLDAATDFKISKPAFYADARLLIEQARARYRTYKEAYPPYGFVDAEGIPVTHIRKGGFDPWLALEAAFNTTVLRVFNEEIPTVRQCPYHETLQNLGSVTLRALDESHPDVDRLREVTAPGGVLAPSTVVNFLRRIPAMATVHQATVSHETLAYNSACSLLSEPLNHPQQWAKPFIFCLAEGYGGEDRMMRRDTFMSINTIAAYTTLGVTGNGRERIEWSMPTTDFTTKTAVRVPDRLAGSERDLRGAHITTYPSGTRLGDIATNEPLIGCPGNLMAYDMWEQAITVIMAEGLWN